MTDIVVSEFIDAGALERLKAEFDVHYDQDLWQKPDALAALMPGLPALIVRNQTQVRGDLLGAADSLTCIGRLGVGLDNIDMDGCAAKGIDVYPATGANSDSVAELAVGGLFVMFRGAYGVTEETAAGGWPRMRLMGREVAGKTLGIVGFGNIGRALNWRAQGIGMKVLAWDPYIPADDPIWGETGAERGKNLMDVARRCDALTVHTPLNDETHGMVDASVIAAMKADAFILNLARGGIVHEGDLVAALRDGRLAGAFLDTFDTEPLPAGNIFAGVPNLILTPHAGARTVEADDRVCNMIADAVMAKLKGR